MVIKTSTKVKPKGSTKIKQKTLSKVKPKKNLVKNGLIAGGVLSAATLGVLGIRGLLGKKGNKNSQEQLVKINVNTDNKNEEFYKKNIEPLIKNLQSEINKLQESNKKLQDEIKKIYTLLDDNLTETENKISNSINDKLSRNEFGQFIVPKQKSLFG